MSDEPKKFISYLDQQSRILPELPEDLREGCVALWYENQRLKNEIEAANAEIARLQREIDALVISDDLR